MDCLIILQQRETSPELVVTCPQIKRLLPLSDIHFDLFPSKVSGGKAEKNEMGGACSAYG